MATNITTFDETTANRIVRMLREHERRSPEIGNRHGRDVSPNAREIRWARTTTNYYYPTYPTSGPAYVVEFGDYSPSPDPPYPGATITNTFTPYDPVWQEVAVDPSGGTWASGTVVRIERHDGRYWIRPPGGTSIPWMGLELSSSFATSSGSFVTPSNDMYCSVYSSWGDEAGTFVTINTGMATYTDTMFTITQAGWYYFGIYAQYILDSDGLVPSTKTYTTSSPSAGAAHTHTVDVDIFYHATPWVYVERQRSGGGSWDNGITAPLTSNYARTAMGPTQCLNADNSATFANINGACLDHTVLAGDKFRYRLTALFQTTPAGYLRYSPNQAFLFIGRIGDTPS